MNGLHIRPKFTGSVQTTPPQPWNRDLTLAGIQKNVWAGFETTWANQKILDDKLQHLMDEFTRNFNF